MIKDKLRKIAVMAERGTPHEQVVARNKLTLLLDQYNLTIQDIIEPDREMYYFSFGTATEKNLLFQIVAHILNVSRVTWYKTSNTRKIGFKLTKLEFLNIFELWDTYREPLKKEIQKYIDSVFSAYIHKHQLFSAQPPSNSPDRQDKSEAELVKTILNTMDNIDRPYKKLEG